MDTSPAPYPPPDAKLPRVDLSADTLAQWKTEAKRIVRDVVHNRQSWYFRFQDYQHLYKPIYAKHNTHGCARVIKRTSVIEFLSRGELDITLDELAYALYCKTNAEQRAVYAQLYQDAFADGVLLKLFEGQKSNDPFHCVAAKWIALRSPMSKIFKGSDFIYFEFCFTTTDANGRKVLIEFKKSHPLRPDQLQDHDLDFTRGRMFIINTYHMENKRVVMQSMGEHDIAANLPVWFALGVMPTFFQRVQNHHGLVYSRALADAGMTIRSLVDRRTEASVSCRVCSKKFKLTRGKKWCRRCGHAVCRDCVTEVTMITDETEGASRLPFVRERFCLLCLFHVREHRTAGDHESVVERHSSLFSIDPEEVNAFEMSHFTAAVHFMDELVDINARRSMDESLLSLSMMNADTCLDKKDQDQKPMSRRTTRSSSLNNVESEPLSTGSTYKNSVDLVDIARVAASQAAMLRYIYHQECHRWQHQTRVSRCSFEEIAPSTLTASTKM